MTENSRIQKTRLHNGLRIITERTPDFKGAVALFRFAVGSAIELPTEWGTAHFLEHMIFQGTKEKNHDTLMLDLARLGATANASTGFESTVFEVTAPSTTILQAIAIMTEMVTGFDLSPKMIELERDIILEEWRMTRDDPAAWGEDCLYQQVMGNFGHPILGTEESVKEMTRSQLRHFADSYYTPDHLIISVVGDVAHEQVVEIIEKWFAFDTRQGKKQRSAAISQSYRYHIAEENEQEQVFLGFQAPAIGDKKLPAFDILTAILGGDSWSRLFRKIRNELGLAYSIGGFYTGWKKIGLYGIQSATHPDNAKNLLEAIKEEIISIGQSVTDDEIEIAKAALRANILFGSDQVSWRGERLLLDELIFGRTRNIEEDLTAIENVTQEDVMDLATTVLDLKQSTLVTVGSKVI